MAKFKTLSIIFSCFLVIQANELNNYVNQYFTIHSDSSGDRDWSLHIANRKQDECGMMLGLLQHAQTLKDKSYRRQLTYYAVKMGVNGIHCSLPMHLLENDIIIDASLADSISKLYVKEKNEEYFYNAVKILKNSSLIFDRLKIKKKQEDVKFSCFELIANQMENYDFNLSENSRKASIYKFSSCVNSDSISIKDKASFVRHLAEQNYLQNKFKDISIIVKGVYDCDSLSVLISKFNNLSKSNGRNEFINYPDMNHNGRPTIYDDFYVKNLTCSWPIEMISKIKK